MLAKNLLVGAALALLASSPAIRAQDQPGAGSTIIPAASTPAAAGARPAPVTPTAAQGRRNFKVDVVLTRQLAGKDVGRLPFTLWLAATPASAGGTNASSGAQSIRVGVDVPVGTTTKTGGSQTAPTTTVTQEYRNIGTSIDARVSLIDETACSLWVIVQDSSIFVPPAGPANTMLAEAFRTLSIQNTWTMHDGQTAPFGLATDKVTGETVRLDVTLTVVK